MRLHRLTITGVGPFRDRQDIDFDELTASRLFLIHGPTGSGKTTIIDAITYALYGSISASADAATVSDRIRSSFCRPQDPTGVTCEFSVGVRRFRVHRVPSGAPDPNQPGRTPRAQPIQVLEELAEDGMPLAALTRRSEVNERIADILGLSSTQFRQLVVLPQGKFHDLLTKTPTERLTALATLLEDDRIEALQAGLIAAGQRALDERHEAREAVRRDAQRFNGALHGHASDELPDVDAVSQATDPASIDLGIRASALFDAIHGRAQTAAGHARSLEEPAIRARARADDARATLEAIRSAETARTAHRHAEARLHEADRDLDPDVISERLSEINQRIGRLTALAEWENQESERLGRRTEIEREIQTLVADHERCEAERSGLPSLRLQVEGQRQAAQLIAARADEYREELARLHMIAARLQAQHAAEADVERMRISVDDLVREHRRAQDELEGARRDWLMLLDAERADAVTALAQRLIAGEPCPVCGACEHPAPATVIPDGQPEGPTTAPHLAHEIDEAQRRVETAERVERERNRAREDAQGELSSLRERVAAARGSLHGQSETDVAASVRTFGHLVESSATSAHEVAHCERVLAELQMRAQELDELASATGTRLTLLRAQLTGIDAQRTGHHEELRRLGVEGLTATVQLDIERERVAALTLLQSTRTTLDVALAAVPAAHRDRTVVALQEVVTEAQLQAEAAESALADARDDASVLAAACERTRPLLVELQQALAHQEDVERRTAHAIELSRLVNADNARKLQLRSFALLRRFATVLAVASGHLQRMSSGKFTFEVADDPGRGQSGLGIGVINTWTGARQDPRSLSGGETFYASLALALGLADIIRSESGAARLDTLFVDEGFGSLDQDTLSEVLDQLGDLRSGSRTVGVVSHVTEMREVIADRLEVRTGNDRTSTIIVG